MIYAVAAHTGHDPVTIETTWTLRQLYAVWDAVQIKRRTTTLTILRYVNGILGGKKKGGRGSR